MITALETVRHFYEAVGRGDVAAVVSLLGDRIEWTEAERFPYFSGTWHTPQEVVDKLLVPLATEWEGFAAVPHDFISEGNRIVSLGTYSGTYRKTGRSFSAAFAHIWTVHENQLMHFNMYTDTAKILEALNPRASTKQ